MGGISIWQLLIIAVIVVLGCDRTIAAQLKRIAPALAAVDIFLKYRVACGEDYRVRIFCR